MKLILAALLILTAGAAHAQTLEKVAFGTNWVAEAEDGGVGQALADGTDEKYGLDGSSVPGGPQVNGRIVLPVGKIDFVGGADARRWVGGAAENGAGGGGGG